jgi:surfactin synthase thioesterase subunit
VRFNDPFARDLAALVDDLAGALGGLDDLPIALFGHSLGARVAFELARRLPHVVHVFVSAAAAPHLERRTLLGDKSDPELVQWLREVGGTPAEVFESRELVELSVRTLRADVDILERAPLGDLSPIAAPLTALAATGDRWVPLDDARAWKQHASGVFRLVQMPGGHFYFHAPAARQRLFVEILRALDP